MGKRKRKAQAAHIGQDGGIKLIWLLVVFIVGAMAPLMLAIWWLWVEIGSRRQRKASVSDILPNDQERTHLENLWERIFRHESEIERLEMEGINKGIAKRKDELFSERSRLGAQLNRKLEIEIAAAESAMIMKELWSETVNDRIEKWVSANTEVAAARATLIAYGGALGALMLVSPDKLVSMVPLASLSDGARLFLGASAIATLIAALVGWRTGVRMKRTLMDRLRASLSAEHADELGLSALLEEVESY